MNPTIATTDKVASISAASVPQGKAGKQQGGSPALVTTEVKSHQWDLELPEPNFLWSLQRTMWRITRDKTLAGCHRWLAPYAGAAHVEYAGKGNNSRFGGLQDSHSVWSSPLSSSTICSLRGKQLGAGFENWLKTNDHSVIFLTLTLRHSAEDSLPKMWDWISYCWRGVTAGKAWRDSSSGDKARFGIAHTVRAVEVTHGRNGWHVHTHVALLLDSSLSEQDEEVLKSRIFSRWSRAAERKGLVAPSEKRGIDLQQVISQSEGKAVAGYLTKGMLSGLGKELSSGALKSARGANRTPFQVLEQIGLSLKDSGKADSKDLAVWLEWERGSKGRRQMLWSKGCKQALGICDLTDEELVEQELVEEERTAVVSVPHDEWRKIQSDVPLRQAVLDACSRGRTAKEAQKFASEVLQKCEIAHNLIQVDMSFHQPPGDRCPGITEGSKDLLKLTKEEYGNKLLLKDLTLF